MTMQAAPSHRPEFGTSQVRMLAGGVVLGVAGAGILAAIAGFPYREGVQIAGAVLGGLISAVLMKRFSLF